MAVRYYIPTAPEGAVAVPATTPLDIKMEDGLVRTSDGRLVFFTKDDGEA